MTVTTQSGHTITLESIHDLEVIYVEEYGYGLYCFGPGEDDDDTQVLYHGDRWTCERLLVELEADAARGTVEHVDVPSTVERLLARVA